MSFTAANKAKTKRHAEKKAAASKPAKAHVLTPAEIERKLPEMTAKVQGPGGSFELIDIAAIDIASGNRDAGEFTPEALEELGKSIAATGLWQPIVVRRLSSGVRFELIAGERRLRACKLINWSKIPAFIREATLDGRLIENTHRKPLSFAEESDQVEALYTEALAKDKNVDGFVGKQAADAAVKAVAVRVGKSEYWIRERLMLAGLDQEIKDAVLAGQISLSVARKLAQIECNEDQKAAAKAIKNRMSSHAVSYRGLPTADELDRMIGEYLYRLQGVKWRLDQPFAGKPACDTCEHNSNNSLWRVEQLTKDGKPIASFRDGASKSDGVAVDAVLPKEGVCSNGACYRVKAEQAKAAVDRAAGRAVTHLTRTAEGFEGTKASPRKIAERALQHARPAAIANVVPEGINPAAVLGKVKPKLERMASHQAKPQAKSRAETKQPSREEVERHRKIMDQVYDEYTKIVEQQMRTVADPLQAYFTKHLSAIIVLEQVLQLPEVLACSSFDKRAREKALRNPALSAALSIVAMNSEKAIHEIAKRRFGNTGLGNHNPFSPSYRESNLETYDDAYVAIMSKVARVLNIEVPSVKIEPYEDFAKRRAAEIANQADAEEEPAVKRVPKVAPARKSSANKARVPDVEAEEDTPRGQGDVDRDEAEGSDDE